MTAITLSFASALSTRSTMRKFLTALREGIDALAAYRMQRAVPEHELHRIELEISRLRRLMRVPHAIQNVAQATVRPVKE